jgi:hypothetical protein
MLEFPRCQNSPCQLIPRLDYVQVGPAPTDQEWSPAFGKRLKSTAGVVRLPVWKGRLGLVRRLVLLLRLLPAGCCNFIRDLLGGFGRVGGFQNWPANHQISRASRDGILRVTTRA